MSMEPTPVGGERRFPVTELGPDAASELVALSGAAYPLTAGPDQKPTVGQVAAELADPDVMTLGVREPVAGRPLVAAACVRVNPDDRGVADVARLVVAPGRRRSGLGSLLLRAAEHRLPAQVRELWLQINPADEYSRRLYGRWSAQVTIVRPDGRPGRKTLYGKSQKAVLAQAREVERRLDSGRPVSTSRLPTLAAYGEQWLVGLGDAVTLGRLAPLTAASYAAMWRRHILPDLGSVRLDQLQPTHLTRWLAHKSQQQSSRGRPLAPRTVNYAHTVLRIALNEAVRDELIDRNAATLVRPPRPGPSPGTPLTAEEVDRVLAASEGQPLRALWVVLLGLGLRLGEALALQWDDLDANAATLRIERSVGRVPGRVNPETGRHHTEIVVKRPKTAASTATLPVPDYVLVALRNHRMVQTEQRLAAVGWTDQNLIFATDRGTHRDQSNVRQRWKTTCRIAGIERNIRLHDLRHSNATFLLAGGVPMRVVMEMLRHTRMATTSDLYAHVGEPVKREAALAMDNVFKGLSQR